MKDLLAPEGWSQVAVDILAQRYFRKAGVPGRTELVPEATVSCAVPVSPKIRSLPAPASMVSAPEPPKMTSLLVPDATVSCAVPVSPKMTSLPVAASIVSCGRWRLPPPITTGLPASSG